MKIGKIKISSPIFLAPMASITDLPFRRLCKKYGAGLCFTEMVNCRRLIERDKKTVELARTLPEEEPAGVQLFGNRLEDFRNASKLVSAKLIDINFGCPVQKRISRIECSALLDHPDLMQDIVHAVKESKKTVTVKIRLGHTRINVVENCKLLEKAGADAITIHARTRQQGYAGKADWKYIRLAKESISIPVIGNGDVTSGRKAKEMLKKADYCMIGRAAIGHPRIFKIINDYLNKGGEPEKIKLEYQMEDFFEYFKLAKKYDLDKFSRIKEQCQNFIKGVRGASRIRGNINNIKSIDELFNLINDELKSA